MVKVLVGSQPARDARRVEERRACRASFQAQRRSRPKTTTPSELLTGNLLQGQRRRLDVNPPSISIELSVHYAPFIEPIPLRLRFLVRPLAVLLL